MVKSLVQVDLACSWPEASRYLPRGWRQVLGLYVEHDRSSIVSACLLFPEGDILLDEFLDFAEPKRLSEPGAGGLLDCLRGKADLGPLLRRVRRWNEYEFADLQDFPVVELLLDRTIELERPLSRYYRAAIESSADCPDCGEVHVHQEGPLRLASEIVASRGDLWEPEDQIALTENYELLVSDRLRRLWQTMAGDDAPRFMPVEGAGDGVPVWQAAPQGTAHVLAPPTPLHALDSCPACGRPLTLALTTDPHPPAFGPDRRTVHEDEALLTLDAAPLPAGDLWVGDAQQGRVRELTEVLQRFGDDPDPFYLRPAYPFWLISQRLLRLLHEHVPAGWRCRPVIRAGDG